MLSCFFIMNYKYDSLVTRIPFLTYFLISNVAFHLAKILFVWMDQTFKAKSITALIDFYSPCHPIWRGTILCLPPAPIGKSTRNSTAQASNSLVLMQNCFMKRQGNSCLALVKNSIMIMKGNYRVICRWSILVMFPCCQLVWNMPPPWLEFIPSAVCSYFVSRDSSHQFIWIP